MNTFAHTGIRLTELASLHVQDVSFDGKGAINIQRAKNRYGRRIPLTYRLKSVLRAYIEEQGVLDADVLFVNVENQPLSARSIQAEIRRYGKITGAVIASLLAHMRFDGHSAELKSKLARIFSSYNA